jgi:hypothetical protein
VTLTGEPPPPTLDELRTRPMGRTVDQEQRLAQRQDELRAGRTAGTPPIDQSSW